MAIKHARRPRCRTQARNPRVQQLVDALQLGQGTQATSSGQSPEGPARGSASWRRVPLEHLGVKGIVEALACLSKLGDNERFEMEMEALVQARVFVTALTRLSSMMPWLYQTCWSVMMYCLSAGEDRALVQAPACMTDIPQIRDVGPLP